jgi:hypothetical protein
MKISVKIADLRTEIWIRTFRIWSRIVNHSVMTFGNMSSCINVLLLNMILCCSVTRLGKNDFPLSLTGSFIVWYMFYISVLNKTWAGKLSNGHVILYFVLHHILVTLSVGHSLFHYVLLAFPGNISDLCINKRLMYNVFPYEGNIRYLWCQPFTSPAENSCHDGRQMWRNGVSGRRTALRVAGVWWQKTFCCAGVMGLTLGDCYRPNSLCSS